MTHTGSVRILDISCTEIQTARKQQCRKASLQEGPSDCFVVFIGKSGAGAERKEKKETETEERPRSVGARRSLAYSSESSSESCLPDAPLPKNQSPKQQYALTKVPPDSG